MNGYFQVCGIKNFCALTFVILASLFSNAYALNPPVAVTSDGVGVYTVSAASTDPAAARRSAAAQAIGTVDSNVPVVLSYSDGKYERAVTSFLRGVDLSGDILNDITLISSSTVGSAAAQAGYGLGSPACGQNTIWVTGFISNWIIGVNGVPVYGSDFIGTGVTVEENGPPCQP